MTFEAYESSVQDSRPVELYSFSKGVVRLNYTSADLPIAVPPYTYEHAAIERTSFDETSEIARANVTITAPQDFDPSLWFSPYPPSEVVELSIMRLQRDDPDQEVQTLWIGRVLSVTWEGAVSKLKCESFLTSMRRPGLRRKYQRACPHQLYGVACGVASISFRSDATITGVAGATVNAAALAAHGDGYYAGGYLEWQSGTRTERRAIRSQVADAAVLSHPIVGLSVGATVRIFAGCAHSATVCAGTFSNLANYGGFLHIPKENPFGTDSVFY